MIKDNVRDAINTQMNREFYSSFLYLSMAAYFESVNLKGFSTWMQVQAKEEHAHGMKFFGYLVDQGARIPMAAIEAPPAEWETPLGAFEHALGHEQKVTGLIHDLVELALSERDHATAGMLQWFVSEQVEEEANATEIVFKTKLASAEKGTALLYLLNHESGNGERAPETGFRHRSRHPPFRPVNPAGLVPHLILVHGSPHHSRCRHCPRPGLFCGCPRLVYQGGRKDRMLQRLPLPSVHSRPGCRSSDGWPGHR